MQVKLLLLIVIALSFLLYWLLPKTALARKMKMSESLFVGMNILGILSGLLGLIISMLWQEEILANHIFELILLPVFLVYLYSAVIMKVRNSDEIYDEKQISDMTRAAAISFLGSFIGIFIFYTMFAEGILEGLVWFPLYLFLSLFIYSGSALYYFKKE